MLTVLQQHRVQRQLKLKITTLTVSQKQTYSESNVTYFEYNDKGQITKRTDAYGKPEALSVETTWHESLNEPVLITYPDKQESFKYNSQGLLINKSVIAL